MPLKTIAISYLTLKRRVKTKFHVTSLYNKEHRWAILLGILVLLPFVSVSMLGLYNYKLMESTRDMERMEKSQIEISLFEQQLRQQITELTRHIHKMVLTTYTDNNFHGLRLLTQSEPLFSLIVSYSNAGMLPDKSEITNSYVETSLLTDTIAERIWAQNYLIEQQVNSIWAPVRSIIGNAYLYCWRQKDDLGFCVLTPTDEMYKMLWRSQTLQHSNQKVYLQDSFMQTVGIVHEGFSQASTLVNINGLQFTLSTLTTQNDNQISASLWLILAMTLPSLGLALTIAWMIFINHRKQIETAKKLLQGTQEIAHELRTPLSNVSLYLGLILRESMTKSQREYGEVITQEMERMTRIIDNATELMRGNQPEHYEYGNPASLVNDLVSQYSLSLAESSCLLTGECFVTTNYFYPKYAIEHVVLNLLSNAKKYAPGQQVTLGLSCKNNKIFVWVDNQFVAKNTLNRHATPIKQSSGLGLGLKSCKRLAKNLGGNFTCSIHKNGRCYTACFPLKKEQL